MLIFNFVESPPSYNSARIFYVRIDPAISTSVELLNALYYSLWLPGYFGFNWDALYDCLRDLSWIAYHKIVVVHESLPLLPKKDLQIYLEVLRDAMLHWSGDEQHEFEVFFSCLDKVLIEEIFLKSS